MQKIYFYITTPLYHVTAKPHIGHAYTTLAADALARHKRARQIPVFFQTGTTEHGAGTEKLAAAANMPPAAWCDAVSGDFKRMWKLLNVNYDHFSRTTDPEHKKRAQAVFERLLGSGDIYAGGYSGLYCRACGIFYEEGELQDGKCPAHGAPVKKVSEKAYFFRLARYQKLLLKYYSANRDFLAPAARRRDIISVVKAGLKDVPVSRAGLAWGVRTPSDPSQTMHAWFEGLLNYATGPGLGDGAQDDAFQMKWPADVHLAGKEAFLFHAAIWPAVLMALKLEPPRRVFAHGWWTADGEKISNSSGNSVDPETAAGEYGADALRYFLFREARFGRDREFSMRKFRRRYNDELADGLGSLMFAVLDMAAKYLDNRLPGRPQAAQFFDAISADGPEIDALMDGLRFDSALDMIWGHISALNEAIKERKPWNMAAEEPESVKPFLYDLIWSLRAIAGWIYPFMPDTATKMQLALSVGKTGTAGLETQKTPRLFPPK